MKSILITDAAFEKLANLMSNVNDKKVGKPIDQIEFSSKAIEKAARTQEYIRFIEPKLKKSLSDTGTKL